MEYLKDKRMLEFDILLFLHRKNYVWNKFHLSVFIFCFKNKEYNGPMPVKRIAIHVEK